VDLEQQQKGQNSSDDKDPQKLRVKLIEALNKRNEVKEILDYYDANESENYSGMNMNPIMFTFHLPLSLQIL
jgi:hypothetical protein